MNNTRNTKTPPERGPMIQTYTLAQTRRLLDRRPNIPVVSSFDNDRSQEWDDNLGTDGTKDALLRGLPRLRLTKLSHQLQRHMSVRLDEGEEEFLSARRGVLDKGRWQRGNPRCLWDTMETPRPLRVVKVGVLASTDCSVNAECWEQRGAAVLALIAAAERIGIRLQIDSITQVSRSICSYNRHYDIQITTPLVRPGIRTPRKPLAFALAHSAFFRRAVFRQMEDMAEQHGMQMSYGYGGPTYGKLPGYDVWIESWRYKKSPEDLIKTAVGWTEVFKDPS